MTEMKNPAVGTLIGDVVGSRATADRAVLHERLTAVLDELNKAFAPTTPLRITIGDEYQGVFTGPGEALQASLRVRLALLPDHDVRHGIGWGEVSLLQSRPRVEDGPGWWAARDAIEAVQRAEQRTASRRLRTAFRAAEASGGPDSAAVNAALVLRDEQIGGLSDRSLAVLRGLLAERTQREIADSLGVSASAVSQRVRTDGLLSLVTADHLMGAVGAQRPPP